MSPPTPKALARRSRRPFRNRITFIVGDLGAPFVGYSMTVMLYPSCHGYPDIISLGCIDDGGYIIFEHINSCGSPYHWRSFLHLEPHFLGSFHDISEVDGDNDVDGGSDNGDNSDYSNDGRSGGGIGVHDESYAIWPDHGTVAAFRPMIPVFIHVYGLDRVFHAPPLLLPYNVYTAHYLRISVCLRPIAGAPPNSYNRTMIIYPSCHDHPDIISIDAISDREVFQFEHISYCQSRYHLRSFRNILEPVLNPHHPPPDGNGRGGGSSGGHRGAGNGGRGIGFLNNNRSNHGGPVTFLPPHPFEDASGSHNDVRDRSGYGLRGILGQADLISHFSNGGGEIGLPDKHQCEVKQEKLQDDKSAVFEVPTIMHNGSEQPKAWNEISSQEAKRQSIAVITAWQLNERMYGELQGLNKQGTADRFGKEKVHEWLCSYDITPPNGKSIEMRAERTVAYFKEHVSIIVHYESELAKAWSEFFHAERKHQASPVTTACQLNEIMSIAASSTYGELQFLNKQETADIFDKQKVQECCCNYDLPSPNRNSLLICTERDLSYFKKHAVPQLLAVKHLIIASHESSLRSIIMFLVKLASQEVINLEIWTGVPMHYIFKEGKFIRSGSPVALSESSIYACARSKPQLLTVMVAAYGNSLRSILPDLETLTSQEVKDSKQSIGILVLYIIMEGKSLENRSLVAPSKAAGLASGICMSVLSSAAAPND